MLWKSTLFYTVSLLILSGCVGSSPTPKEETPIDATLPVVTLTQNGIVADMEAIALEWKSIEDSRVKGIYIYKANPVEGETSIELKYVQTVKNRFTTHYIDTEIKPNTRYSYAFKTFSSSADGEQSQIYKVQSLPILESVSWIHSTTGMPRSAKIIWRPHSNESVKSYILQRKTLQDEEWDTLTTIDGRLNAEYIDADLKDNYVYEYRIKVKTYSGIVSYPSKSVKVVTKALPLGVVDIQTTLNLPKKIKLTWKKTTVKDFQFYYVYRAESIDGTYKLIATLYNPLFDDVLKKDGKSYFYRVSVVDKDGLESEHEKISVQGMSIPKPEAPAVINANLVGNTAELVWNRVDPRTVSYTVLKKAQKGWFDVTSTEFKNITNKKFIDPNIADNTTYTYAVYALDKYGIKSNPSVEIKFKTKESKEIIDAPVDEPKKEVNTFSTNKTSEVTEVISPVADLDVSGL